MRLIVQRYGDFALDPTVRVSGRGELVPYVKLHSPPAALVSITSAPGANVPRTMRALQAVEADGGVSDWAHIELRESALRLSW